MDCDANNHDGIASDFHGLFRRFHIKKTEKRKKEKSSKRKTGKAVTRLAIQVEGAVTEPNVQILGNASPFAVYAAMRSHVHDYNFVEACKKLMLTEECEPTNEEPTEDTSHIQLSKLVGFGIETVFQLISEGHRTYPHLCVKALESLLSMLEGLHPQSLKHENQAVLDSLFNVLLEIADCTSAYDDGPSVSNVSPKSRELSKVATSCLISLAIARGDTKQLLQTVVALIQSDETFIIDKLKNPDILKSLQLSIQSLLVGRQVLPDWLSNGIPQNAHVDSFNVKLPDEPAYTPSEERCLACNGGYLYLLSDNSLFMIGTGSFGTTRGEMYDTKLNFGSQEKRARVWVGCANSKFYYHATTTSKLEMRVYLDGGRWELLETVTMDTPHELDESEDKTLDFCYDGWDRGAAVPYFFFTDGDTLGYITCRPKDVYLVRTLPPDCIDPTAFTHELKIHLVKRSIHVTGPGTMDNGTTDLRQIETGFDDGVVEISAGKDFSILRNQSGSLLYCGKGASLGQKGSGGKNGKWLELNLTKSTRFVQAAIGHEGMHSILLAEDGTAYFVGTPKRGEDGDIASFFLGKARRVAKACKPKKVNRMDGLEISYVACNNGTSAFVTKSGELYLFGKDACAPYCDSSGLLTGLLGHSVSRIALGKAHSVILTTEGEVFTMGMNNKGQCGRPRPSQREDDPADDDDEWEDAAPSGGAPSENEEGVAQVDDGFCVGQHRWKHDQCMVCTVCRECTGYGSACISALRPDRNPGQECGCGVGDAGCEDCGMCRQCAREGAEELELLGMEGAQGAGADFQMPEAYEGRMNPEDGEEGNNEEAVGGEVLVREEKLLRRNVAVRLSRADKEKVLSGSTETDSNMVPFSTLVKLDTEFLGGPVVQIAAGLYHTVLLTSSGRVFVFGSNNMGQLGLGDRESRFEPEEVYFRTQIVQIAAGSNHTVCLDVLGNVYTAGSNSRQQLGTSKQNYETEMTKIKGFGVVRGRRVTWIGASGDSTFLIVEASLINKNTLAKCSITATKKAILIIPPATKKRSASPIIIDRRDGCCHQIFSVKQWNITSSVAVLDPVFQFLWTFEPESGNLKCLNVVASEIRGGDNPANVALLKPPYALPMSKGTPISRWHAGANLLTCIDTLISARCQNLSVNMNEHVIPPTRLKNFTRDDYLCVTRFDTNGGGWGYANNCAEAIRFSCDADILLGGYGLYGGRGEYTASIKLFDIGVLGGDWETDGELLAQSDDFVYDTLPRHKFRAMFEDPIRLQAGRWYVAWALISGPSSDCGANGQTTVRTDDHVTFLFKSSKKATNGTDVNAGQLPQLLYRTLHTEPGSLDIEIGNAEPISVLTPDFASVFTPSCVQILTSLFNWCETEITKVLPKRADHKFDILIYVSRLCLRLVDFSTKQAYPVKGGTRSSQMDSLAMADAIGDVRVMLQRTIMLEIEPSDVEFSDVCDIMQQACTTYTDCFGIFYPTSTLKWECVKSVISLVKTKGLTYLRLFICCISALCGCRGQLLSIFPILRNHSSPELSRDTNFAFITNTDGGGKMKPNNRMLVSQMTSRFESDDLFVRVESDFWETVRFILETVDSAQTSYYGPLVARPTSVLLGTLIEELVAHACGTYSDIENVVGSMIVMSPCRFARTNQSRTWNTGMGSADAVGFVVDQEGVSIFGACIYIGVGSYNYILELLQEVEDKDLPDRTGYKWVTLSSVSGSFESEDCVGDIAELRLPRPVHIQAGVKYAFRLANHGGRTCNGDGGVSVLRCTDGTTFTFSACPLSLNGTNQIRGQLPYILYFRNPNSGDGRLKTKVIAEMDARHCCLRLCEDILKWSNERLKSYAKQMRSSPSPTEELVLHFDPENPGFISTLLPEISCHLQKLAASDPRSCVKLLELSRDTLKHLAELNLLYSKAGTTGQSEAMDWGVHYAWVESTHPYKPAALSQYQVTFPSRVKEMTIEFDPRCVTAQDEDILKVCIPFDPTVDQEQNDDGEYAPYITAVDKCFGAKNWPDKAIVIPGNDLLFSFETASDHVRGERRDYFGFRCLVTGYEYRNSAGFQEAELELSHLAGFCSHELMKRSLVLPPVSAEELKVPDEEKASDEVALATCLKHHALFSKGIGIQYFPSVQEALDGLVPLRENSKEREFIADFIGRTPNSSGERLANWIQPESFVDPEKCQIIFPKEKMRRGRVGTLTFVTRDQYGDVVTSPGLLVEMMANPLRSCHAQKPSTSFVSASGRRNYNLASFLPSGVTIPETPFEATVKDKMRYMAITMMKEYENFSFEELRLLCPVARTNTEPMLIRDNGDGTYVATWCPTFVGSYHLSVTVDGYAVPQISAIEVEDTPDGALFSKKTEDSKSLVNRITFSNKRKFQARAADSSGLRIRDHPTLQSEQLGLIPLNGIVTFVHEIHNDDGIWVKLDDPSFREHCRNANIFQREGWCLQFNQHLGKTFLFPLEPPKPLPGHQADPSSVTVRKPMLEGQSSGNNAENSNSAKALRLNRGNGVYVVVKAGVGGHNVRSKPALGAAAIGVISLGTKVEAVDERYTREGFWLKLDKTMHEQLCFLGPGGVDMWVLAVDNDNVIYLKKSTKKTEESPRGFDFSEASRVPQNVFQTTKPPITFGLGEESPAMLKSDESLSRSVEEEKGKDYGVEDKKKPTELVSDKSKTTELGDEGSKASGQGRSRSSSTFGALQKWLQMSTESLGGSHSQATTSGTGKSSTSMIQASKSFVKDGIHALSSAKQTTHTVPHVLTNSATQTSPEIEPPAAATLEFPRGIQFHIGTTLDVPTPKGSNDKRKSRSLSSGNARDRKSSQSPRGDSDEQRSLPVTITPPVTSSAPVKEAIGPGDAQSVRAVFGAVIWYAGIIHDVMAVASFLKFILSPSTQKSPPESVQSTSMSDPVATTVTPSMTKRGSADSKPSESVRYRLNKKGRDRPKKQRHSVEASSSPWLLNANPTMASEKLEFLSQLDPKRSDSVGSKETDEELDEVAAAYFEMRRLERKQPGAVVALRKIWMYVKKNCNEALLQELFRGLRYNKMDGPMKLGAVKVKRDRKARWANIPEGPPVVGPPSVGGSEKSRVVGVPEVASKSEREKPKEMQATGRSFLVEEDVDPAVEPYEFSQVLQCEVCRIQLSRPGKSRKSYFGFARLCENCVDSQLKVKRLQSQGLNKPRSRTVSDLMVPYAPSTSIHGTVLNNALFLLEMINTSTAEAVDMSAFKERERKKLKALGNSFVCLEALGVTEDRADVKDDMAGSKNDLGAIDLDTSTSESKPKLEGLLSPSPSRSDSPEKFAIRTRSQPNQRRRKTSNGDHGTNKIGGIGLHLLNKPSAGLQKFLENVVDYGEQEALSKLCGTVMAFISEKHDLAALKLFLYQTIRKVTCRSYGMESFAWLLRHVSQPMALHDLFWWYASTVDPKSDQQEVKQEEVDDDGWWQIRTHPLGDSPLTLFPFLSDSFYVLLQTMSDIMKYLPIGSPLLEMAVKCWGVSFSRKDHLFLHKCKIFRNLSKIMSQFDGDTEGSKSSVSLEYHDGEVVSVGELTTAFVDLIPHADVKVSSRNALCSSLTDESTETFWESGDDDRMKHIVITNRSTAAIRTVGIYLDNVKDNAYRVTSICTKVGSTADDCLVYSPLDVDAKFVGWMWFTIKDPTIQVVRFDLKGSDSNIRVRQVKMLGVFRDEQELERSMSNLAIARQKCERETLRIFRSLSSEVFGKLLSEGKHGEDEGGNDLQEHVVGILFSRNKLTGYLTNLQRQVCSHIVAAIHRESVKIKEEFDLNLPSGTIMEVTDQFPVHFVTPAGERPKVGDRYCFEMLSLVLALAGSKVGRSYLSRQNNLIQDLVQLLHIGTPRIQRQVLQVIRKILPEIAPADFSAIIGTEPSSETKREGIVLDVFLGIICKALQMKARATGYNERSRMARTINLSDMLEREDFPTSYWFLHGEVETALALSVVRLIKDMTEGVFAQQWQSASLEAIGQSILYIPKIDVERRVLEACLSCPNFWMSVATLCVLHESHALLLSYPYKNGHVGRPLCSNHDDSETVAVIQCAECGDLCADCDRILHLPKRVWNHVRNICKEEEETINVDLHEGCGRIKLFWLTAMADSSTLKALVEFRQGIPKVNERDASPMQAMGLCRFCGVSATTGPLALGRVCADPECQEYAKVACDKILPCSHLCGGVKGEVNCLPCLQRCGTEGEGYDKLRQDGEDMCMICFTDSLANAPALQLNCGHVFHYHCCVAVLQRRWAGPRITFTFSTCPVCKTEMKHDLLSELLGPIFELSADVRRKALMRLEYEGMSGNAAITTMGGQYYRNPGLYAMDRYAYYLCFKCKKPYFGGDARCDVEIQPEFDPEELVCGGCSDISQAQLCPKHGTDYLEYKCRYCCSVAVFFCFGTTHFCNGCHDDFQRVTSIPKSELPQCPAGPRCKQLDVEDCPLDVEHPPTGEEFALGCGICRNAYTF